VVLGDREVIFVAGVDLAASCSSLAWEMDGSRQIDVRLVQLYYLV
jgi:hypothetical protein